MNSYTYDSSFELKIEYGTSSAFSLLKISQIIKSFKKFIFFFAFLSRKKLEILYSGFHGSNSLILLPFFFYCIFHFIHVFEAYLIPFETSKKKCVRSLKNDSLLAMRLLAK